jgi:hypothetical protein
MHYVIRFETSKFDVSQEDANREHPVWGRSLLLWLKERLSGQYQFGEPDRKDSGWFTTIEWQGRTYRLCASAMESATEGYEWVLQVVKERSLREKLSGTEPMTRNDECLQFFKSVFESDSEFKHIAIE